MKKTPLITSLFFALSINSFATEQLVLPESFYKLSPELQKEIMLDEVKLKNYLEKFGKRVDGDSKTQTPVLKESKGFNSATVKKISELTSDKFIQGKYEGPVSFQIKDSKGSISNVNVGSGNGYTKNDEKLKLNIEGAIVLFPNGEFTAAEIDDYIEDGEVKIIQVERENALELRHLSYENKTAHIVIAYFDGELYLDVAAGLDALKLKVDKDLRIKKDSKLKIDKKGVHLNLTQAKITVKKR